MIIPDDIPPYADDGRPFSERMMEYIRTHWGAQLGERVQLLDSPSGLDQLAELSLAQLRGSPSEALARPQPAVPPTRRVTRRASRRRASRRRTAALHQVA